MIGVFFFFKQKTAYEMRISDWSSDVCSSDLPDAAQPGSARVTDPARARGPRPDGAGAVEWIDRRAPHGDPGRRGEAHPTDLRQARPAARRLRPPPGACCSAVPALRPSRFAGGPRGNPKSVVEGQSGAERG